MYVVSVEGASKRRTEMKLSKEIWVAETRMGETVGWTIFSRKTGQIIGSIKYA